MLLRTVGELTSITSSPERLIQFSDEQPSQLATVRLALVWATRVVSSLVRKASTTVTKHRGTPVLTLAACKQREEATLQPEQREEEEWATPQLEEQE